MSSDDLFDVSCEVAIVTGISGQLGAQYARAFLAAGARVVGLDLEPSGACRQLLATHAERFMFVTADVTDRASLRAALTAMQERFGSPSVLVNNAAIDAPPSAPLSENGPYEHYPDASWDRMMDVNA